MKRMDLDGRRFGRLVVLRYSHTAKNSIWVCRCDCGKSRLVAGSQLTHGQVRSCGCTRGRRTHGHTSRGKRSATYNVWLLMIQRCTNPSNTNYDRYGAKGVRVCRRWRKFENFLADMGERPPGCSLDRYPDTKGNYGPGNCRWATRRQQDRNRRHNRLLEHDGRVQCLADWADEVGLSRTGLYYRVVLAGWPIAKALATPPMH